MASISLVSFIENFEKIIILNFLDDSHIDAFSSNCIQLECLAVNFCNKVSGTTLKALFQRSKRLKCLLMNGTSLQSEHVMTVDWDKW